MIRAAHRFTYRDPFTPYAGLMPGQSVDSVEDFGCQLSAGMGNGLKVGYCPFEPEDGIFAEVIVIASDHTITRTDFFVRSNRLVLGDLVLCWGEPIYIADNYYTRPTLEVHWDNQVHVSVMPGSDNYYTRPALEAHWGNQVQVSVVPGQSSPQLSYFSPVATLSFERLWQTFELEKLWCAFDQ